MKMKEIRKSFTSPDNNALGPKTDLFCWRCFKDINPNSKYRFMFAEQDAYHLAIHPEDIGDIKVDKLSIGMNCAKIIGLEFTVKKES